MTPLDAAPALSPESWGVIAGMALTVGAGVILGIRKGWQVIIPILRSTNKATAEIREQVANTHSTNLRSDMDEISGKLDGLATTLGHVHDIVSRHDTELKRVNDHVSAQDARVTALDQRMTAHKQGVDHALHDHSTRLHDLEKPDWRDNP
ncbi:MAG: DUF2746 domain-containing protein [Propionibacteriaceae bacterium]|nr:DUF2746 domain-containing protein [Propionibacteriaceae bacterium]